MYTSETLKQLADTLQGLNRERESQMLPPIILISDEAYHRIVFPSTERPYVSPASHYPYTVSVYSYAKTCLSPAERLGWLVLSPLWPQDKLGMTKKAIDNAQIWSGWLLPSYTNARCIPALERGDGVIVDLDELQRHRDQLADAFCMYPTVFGQVVRPQSGFYMLVKVPDRYSDVEFTTILAERYQVLGMHGSAMGMPGWIRFSVTASNEMIQHTCSAVHDFVKNHCNNKDAEEEKQ